MGERSNENRRNARPLRSHARQRSAAPARRGPSRRFVFWRDRPKDAREMRKQATTAESFGTKASRFVGGGGGGSLFGGESTPGPGHYESAIETTAPLVKRSFNITVGN